MAAKTNLKFSGSGEGAQKQPTHAGQDKESKGFDAIDKAAMQTSPAAGMTGSISAEDQKAEIEKRQRLAALNLKLSQTICIHCGSRGCWKPLGGTEDTGEGKKIRYYQCRGCQTTIKVVI